MHVTLQPNITLSPHPITHCLFTIGLASLRHAQVVPSLFYQILYGYAMLVITSHDTLLLTLVWEITKQDKASVENP